MSLQEQFAAQGLEEMALSREERADLLEKCILGADLSRAEVQTMAGYMSAYRGAAGMPICAQGDENSFLAVVCRGRVGIIKEDIHCAPKEIASVGPGQVVGEMSLVDGEPRSAAVVASSPVLLLILSGEQFAQMAEQVPRLWGKILLRLARTLSRRLRQTSGVLAEYLPF